MEIFLSICLGIGMSAACGFRIFVPMLVVSVASLSGHLSLSPDFQWLGTYPALIAFSVATALEIGAYYIPWLDHALDTIASPAAVVAGVVVSASIITGMSPLLKWTLAIIAGGGVAGLVQGTTVLTRAVSGVTTGGLANPLVATVELGGAVAASVAALLAPVVFLVFLVLCFALVGRKIYRWRKSQMVKPAPIPS